MASASSVRRSSVHRPYASGREAINRRASLLPRILSTILALIGNIGAFMILFQLYKLVRKTFILRAETVAFGNAEQIIDLERRLHLFVEPAMQRWVLDHDWLVVPFNRYYAAFMPLFYLCCAALIVFRPARFAFMRRVFLCSMVIALPWYALYPLAPPRFMPEHGFIDTLAVYGPQYFSENGLVTANHYAAMPSMHIGWSTIGAIMLARAVPYRRIGLVLGALHVALMSITVVVTGNHYLLDILGGWLVVAAAFGAARLLPNLRPRRTAPRLTPARIETRHRVIMKS